VFIYPATYSEDTIQKARKAKAILLKIEHREPSAYTFTLTWDHVVWIVRKTLGRDDETTQGRKLFGSQT